MNDAASPGALPVFPAAPARRPWYHWRRWGFNFLTVSLLAHLFLGVGATYLVVQTLQDKRKQTFAGPPASANAPTQTLEHKVQLRKQQQTMSAPAPVKRITTTSNSKVALPAMPTMPKLDSAVVPLSMAGMGGSGVGLGLGGGGGGKGSGGGGLSLFGLRQKGSSSLVGTFYDFKQTRAGQPTDMAIKDEDMHSESEGKANLEHKKLVVKFIEGGFNEGMLNVYFKGPSPLYTTQLFIPMIPSEKAPAEFGVGGVVRGRRWVVVYRGKVTPPESGRYRFVGMWDDYLFVRFRGSLVLDGSLVIPTGKKPDRQFSYDGMGSSRHCNEGDGFNVQAGEAYDVQIAIGELPGGVNGGCLLLEKEGAEYAKDSKGNPLLPIFKMAPNNASREGSGLPATAPDTSWSVWKADAGLPALDGM